MKPQSITDTKVSSTLYFLLTLIFSVLANGYHPLVGKIFFFNYDMRSRKKFISCFLHKNVKFFPKEVASLTFKFNFILTFSLG